MFFFCFFKSENKTFYFFLSSCLSAPDWSGRKAFLSGNEFLKSQKQGSFKPTKKTIIDAALNTIINRLRIMCPTGKQGQRLENKLVLLSTLVQVAGTVGNKGLRLCTDVIILFCKIIWHHPLLLSNNENRWESENEKTVWWWTGIIQPAVFGKENEEG